MGKSPDMWTKLPSDALEERLRWVLPIINKQIRLTEATKVFPGGKRTLERWVARYRQQGEEGLKPRPTRPKSQPNETLIRVKERIIELKKETKLCAKKLNYKLKKEGINVSDRLIGKVIKTEGLVRKYRIRKLKWKYVKVPLTKGDLVEIDIKYVPDLVNNRQYYQFTAIDCASRWRYLKIYDDYSNFHSIRFLDELIRVAPLQITAQVLPIAIPATKNLLTQ